MDVIGAGEGYLVQGLGFTRHNDLWSRRLVSALISGIYVRVLYQRNDEVVAQALNSRIDYYMHYADRSQILAVAYFESEITFRHADITTFGNFPIMSH
jgi:hypothetical protein